MDADYLWARLPLGSDAHGMGGDAVRSHLEAQARVCIT